MSSGTAPPRWKPLGWPLGFAATALVLALTGMWRMFAHFPGYDDEGYILLTVRNYLEGGGLYARVYSQYGPVFYVLHDVVHRVTGAAVDHAYARWFTLALWLGAAGGVAGLVGAAARSAAAAWFAGVASFLFLHQFSEEAFHPGAVIVGLLPFLLWGLHRLGAQGRPVAAALLAGAGVALLGLLKVNVGLLFGTGVAVGWCLTRAGGGSRATGVVLGLTAAGVLMHGLVAEAWVQVFLTVFGVGLAGLGLAIPPAPAAHGPGRELAGGGAGLALAGGIVLAAVALRGTTPAGLLEGILLRPLQHADSYSYAVDWRPGTLVSALAALVLAILHRAWARRGRLADADALLAGLRLLLLAGTLVVLALLETHRVIGVLFSFAMPWLWVWVAPLRRAEGPDARPLLACVLLLQMLHAYPVGGIQICWGGFLLFALVAAALPETAAWLAGRGPAVARAARLVLVVPVLVAAGKLTWAAATFQARYEAQVPLALPGTGGLRLSERETLAYQVLATNAQLHADRLFSLPGMFSFNLWTGVPTPTLRNTTLWYALLTAGEQAEIVAALERAERPALIVDAGLVGILHGSGAPPTGPLFEHLLRHYRPAFSFHGLGFWVRAGRPLLPVGTAWRQAAETEGYKVAVAGLGRPVARIILREADQTDAALTLDARNCRVTVQAATLDGTPRTAAVEAGWPLVVPGPAWLTIHVTGGLPAFPADRTPVLDFLEADGGSVAVVRVVDGAR